MLVSSRTLAASPSQGRRYRSEPRSSHVPVTDDRRACSKRRSNRHGLQFGSTSVQSPWSSRLPGAGATIVRQGVAENDSGGATQQWPFISLSSENCLQTPGYGLHAPSPRFSYSSPSMGTYWHPKRDVSTSIASRKVWSAFWGRRYLSATSVIPGDHNGHDTLKHAAHTFDSVGSRSRFSFSAQYSVHV